jgi:L-threonylcarbamoyladenylate synthase
MKNLNEEIHNAFEIIKDMELSFILQTPFGACGCDAIKSRSCRKIYKLKQRAETQSMIVLMNGEKMMYNVLHLK